jgi:hypothetical protein
MQLFTIGLHELHANGTKRLDPATAAPIDTYSNVDIVAFARVWTGWSKQGMRRNIQGGAESRNYIDPMRLHADRRDPFPKTKLQGGYLGDGFPLCAELPNRAFLLRGAKYEKIGGHSNLVGREKFDDLAGGGTTTNETVRPHFAPSRGSSQLYAALCAADDDSSGRCAFPAAVVLGVPLACDGPVECGAGTLRNVKMVDGTGRVCFYAYVPPPCTRLAFFEQGNGRYVEQDGNRQCADASVAGSAGVSCCHDLTPVYRLSPRAALMGKGTLTGALRAAWLCMDGDVRTYCMSKLAAVGVWLRFDMGRRVRFSRVKIFNQFNPSSKRFQTFVLELSDSGSSSGSWTACHTGDARGAPLVDARCEGVGRYLRVRSTYTKWLHLNEVQIFGGAAPGEEMPHSAGAWLGATLVFRGDTPPPNLSACEGDCDNDAHCAAGLKCFQRDGASSEDIPGCAAGGLGDKPGTDYCYDPASQPPPLASHGSTPTSYNLSACEGDCDKDEHCAAGLKCFQRDGTAPVPGCSAGGAGDVKDHDYCFEPGRGAIPTAQDAHPVLFSANASRAAASDRQCLYVAEPVTFATAQARCAALVPGGVLCRSKNHLRATAWPPTSEDWLSTCAGYQYDWVDASCAQQIQVHPRGEVSMVDAASHRADLQLDSGNVFAVAWERPPGVRQPGASAPRYPHGRDAQGGEVLFPNPAANCSGCTAIATRKGSCLCDVIVETTAFFPDASAPPPAAAALRAALYFGASPPADFGPGVYTRCATAACIATPGVAVHTRGSSAAPAALGSDAIFELLGAPVGKFGSNARFLLNRRSTVRGVANQFRFRNAPAFLPNLGDSPVTPSSDPYGAPNRNQAHAHYETDALLDMLFYHDNTPPFVARQLIQRLVTSNPSPRYIEAVATAFATGAYGGEASSFSGKRGDMGATVAAILLDREARSAAVELDAAHGRLQEPLLQVLSLMRTLGYRTSPSTPGAETSLWPIRTKIGQEFAQAPSVFGYFSPFYAPSRAMEEAGLVAPEAQLLTTTFTIGLANGLVQLVDVGLKEGGSNFAGIGSLTRGELHFVPAAWAPLNASTAAAALLRAPEQPKPPPPNNDSVPLCASGCLVDAHCAAGLRCLQLRTKNLVSFGSNGKALYDPASQLPPLASHGSTLSSYNLSACEGDCDNDEHCAAGLKCFQRDGTAPVPGCSAGGAGDVKDHDYCFEPNMQACEGDCDSDSDCAGSLKCFQRENREAVPGCANNADVPGNYDFCYASRVVPGCPAAEAGSIPDGGYCYDPNHAAAVVRELATLLTAGRLHGGSRALIEAEYTRVAAARGEAAAVKHAMKLFAVTPEIRVTNLAPPTAKARALPTPLASQGRGYKAVVIINMAGGADSFQMLQPHSGCEIRSHPGPNVSHDLHAELLAVRGADKMQGKDGLLPIDVPPGTQPCDTFGVHPRMKHVASLYGAGDALWIANMGR